MSKIHLPLDWSMLLGFDQARTGTDVLKNAAKIGSKPCESYRAFSAPLPPRE